MAVEGKKPIPFFYDQGKPPFVLSQSDAGSFPEERGCMVGYACEALVRAGVEVGIIELESASLLVPHLRFNQPLFYICLQGEGYFGLVDETGEKSLPAARVSPGDAVAIQAGWTHWAACGYMSTAPVASSTARFLRLALSPSVADQTVLGGSKHPGNVLQGFSSEFLGKVLQQPPGKIEKFLASSHAGGIVKLSEATLQEIVTLAKKVPPEGPRNVGSGRVEIVYPGGRSAARESICKGHVFVVPKGFAFGIAAAKEHCLEVYCLLPHACGGKFVRVLGKGSAYHFLPHGVVADAFGASISDTKDMLIC